MYIWPVGKVKVFKEQKELMGGGGMRWRGVVAAEEGWEWDRENGRHSQCTMYIFMKKFKNSIQLKIQASSNKSLIL